MPRTPRTILLALCCLSVLLVAAADRTTPEQARARFIKIIEKLEKSRFCQSGRCRYEEVHFQVKKTGNTSKPYSGLIRASIVRPSQTIDKARYQFEFTEGRWRLTNGTETTDVNEANYTGENYEFASAYGRTPVRGKLTDSDNDLETGYKLLYLKILDRGRERT